MNYIIHQADDLEPQIQTCLLATGPCAPECENCAAFFDPGFEEPEVVLGGLRDPEPDGVLTKARLVEFYNELHKSSIDPEDHATHVAEEIDYKIRQFGNAYKDIWESGYRDEYHAANDKDFARVLSERNEARRGIEWMGEVRAAQAATIKKYQKRIDEMQKVVDAAVDFTKASSLVDYGKLNALQRAVRNWFKTVDAPSKKS